MSKELSLEERTARAVAARDRARRWRDRRYVKPSKVSERFIVKHITKPGDDLATILISVRNDVMTATDRRQVPWEHSALTARVYFIPPKDTGSSHDQQVELTFWASVKDSTSPTVLRTYLERYPNGEFASIARALIAHYEQQARVALAEQEQSQKRLDEERKATELKRLEEQRRAREAVLAQERLKAKQAKDAAEVKRVEEQEKAEHAARSEAIKKAAEEAQRANAATKAAEEKRNLLTVMSDLVSKSGNKLLSMSAGCRQLTDWRAQKRLLDDYTQYQTSVALMEKPSVEPVEKTCAGLRAQGDKLLAEKAPDIKSRIESVLEKVKMNELRFIGVLAEDATACYGGLIQKFQTEAGPDKTQLTVFAATIVKNKSVFVYRMTVYVTSETVTRTLANFKTDIAALLTANQK